jgi:hypothetical protein
MLLGRPQSSCPVTALTMQGNAEGLLPAGLAAETNRGQRPTGSDRDLVEGALSVHCMTESARTGCFYPYVLGSRKATCARTNR